MQWERITLAGDPRLAFIQALYECSFPPEERRQFSAVKALLPVEEMHLALITTATGVPAGFVIYWQFSRFLFVEHFAIDASFRNQGFGAQVMQQLFMQDSCCLLEVEPPHDVSSEKRIQFYQRLGFHRNAIDYLQPAYHDGGLPVPMLLLSNFSLSPEALASYVSEVRKTVYSITE